MITYRIPDKLDSEIDALEALIADYIQGRTDKTTLKAHRVPFGVYEQRTPDTYMVRVRCAAGVITPRQLAAVAETARVYGSGRLHITTRQEIQIHDVKLEHLIPSIRALKTAGLSTRGGGGNTLRNITAPADTGVSPSGPFDITPYAVGLTELLIADDGSWNLPRKFKIAFSSDGKDGMFTAVNDVGFTARIENGREGFGVTLGGGMGARPSIGVPVIGFVDGSEVPGVALAARNLFAKLGNRKNRHAARLRFVKERLGKSEFIRLFHAEWEEIRQTAPRLTDDPGEGRRVLPALDGVTPANEAEFEAWKSMFTRGQIQPGYYTVTVQAALGDIACEAASALARFLWPFGGDVIRFTVGQNTLLRNIPETLLGNVFINLKQIFGNESARPLFGLTVCAGASTCQLGICLSRGAAMETMRLIESKKFVLAGKETPRIKISGCPNACGQHWTADLGFYGTTFRKDGRLLPAYIAASGAEETPGGAVFAQRIGELPAKNLPLFVTDALEAYARSAAGTFAEFLTGGGKELLAETIAGKYAQIPDYHSSPEFYTDWGADKEFSLEGRGAGECSAGLFDLIERDLKNIAETRAALDSGAKDRDGLLTSLLHYSCRMLLVTRGTEAASLKEAAVGFNEHFIMTGIADKRYMPLLAAVLLDKPLGEYGESIIGLSGDVVRLYESMDDSMNFVREKPESEESAVHFKDLRGVACPMNFVKTKMELAKLKPGDILDILLDDGEPIANVPGSVKSEGHAVLSSEQTDGYWKVKIKKGGQ
ncbi:MAG: hypothetical protein A2Y33_02375 [Spirochaetes bacterium GWF1_51_8]|nr:MAG: hypothetical protein A2Y33_02375 [Spirochaetes bacterium GWF1_51_8]